MRLIHVTQGHEKSIGLEVFLKSFLLLNLSDQKRFILYSYKETLLNTLNFLNLRYELIENVLNFGGSSLKLKILNTESENSQSLISLTESIKCITPGDVLLTIPTTKSQLRNGEIQYTGHTDYFRVNYTEYNPLMFFKSQSSYVCLLTEHIPLSKVENNITFDLIKNKISTLIKSNYKFTHFIFSGVNPHCGEDGLLGDVDKKLSEYITKLSTIYPQLNFSGPLSGDTLPLKIVEEKTCIIAAYHDQGLAPLKSRSGFRAVNITIGLPFLRVSPDHGTAFEIYGKNTSNYLGMQYTMKEALTQLGKQ